jgi:GT2 family glycosyltransferase
MLKLSVVIPNWNGKETIAECLDSLRIQSLGCQIIVVENGSTDGSLEFISQTYPEIELVIHQKNLGFAAGVNAGIKRAIANNSDYVALFNNDAVAEKDWLQNLTKVMEQNDKTGIVTCKFLDIKAEYLDSTGDQYTTWGLPYPRGRGELASNKYDEQTEIFAASGGASLYRISMLKQIGLFDEDFFAYYEDVDISFRAQLAGWKVIYAPKAVAYHQIGATSSKIKGFTTYQTIKNLPMLLWKNVPTPLLATVVPRFYLAYFSFILSALCRGQIWPALKGFLAILLLIPKTILKRYYIQRSKKVSTQYIRSIMTADLPSNAARLRKLRSFFTRH